MPGFNVEVPHQLGKEQALERLRPFVEKVAERYKDQVSKVDGNWVENVLNFTLTTYGFNISGAMTVEENAVRLQGQIPFAAMPFRGKIEQTIGEQLQKQLA